MRQTGDNTLNFGRKEWIAVITAIVGPMASFWFWSIKLENRIVTIENGKADVEDMKMAESRILTVEVEKRAVDAAILRIDSKISQQDAIQAKLGIIENRLESIEEKSARSE